MKLKIFLTLFFISFFISTAIPQNSSFLEPCYFYNDGSTSHYVLDKNLVHNEYGSNVDLFCTPFKGCIVWIDQNTLLGFTIDPSWNKLVYGNYFGINTKSYGRWGTDEYGWYFPRGITTDGLGNIYVADIENGRIIKLIYANDEVTQPSNSIIGSSYLDRPYDLDVDDRGNQSPTDDIIWVVDRGVGKVFSFKVSGSLWGEEIIERLYNASTHACYNDLSGINSVAIRKIAIGGVGVNSTSNRRLYLLDIKNKKLFLVEADVPENGVAQIYKEISLSSTSLPYDVESDYFGDIWVADRKGNNINKYTWDLNYLTSLTGLNQPTGISSTRRHHLNMAITERWTNTTGNRTYFHGADIKNLHISTGYTSANFSFTMTNWNYLTAKIYKGSTYITTLDNGTNVYSSGPVSLNLYISNPTGTYTLKLRADSYEQTNEEYIVYKSVERNFSFPFRAYITGPSALEYMEIGDYYANVTGGTSSNPIYYQWYIKWDGESSWSPKGTTQKTSQKMYDRRNFTLKVCVTRGNEYAEDTHHVLYNPLISKPLTYIDIPDQFSISQNYPNPFNPVTTIHMELPEDIEVSLIAYNILGQEVGIIEEGIKKAGRYDISWDASNLPSGIYIVNLKAGTFIKSYKAVLLK